MAGAPKSLFEGNEGIVDSNPILGKSKSGREAV